MDHRIVRRRFTSNASFAKADANYKKVWKTVLDRPGIESTDKEGRVVRNVEFLLIGKKQRRR